MNKTIYALGFFDGVHMGHGALLCAVRTLAKEHTTQAGVVTFGSHPDTLVTGHTPRLINTARDRQKLLQEKYHMERVLTLPFDEAMRSMPWQDFLTMLRRDYGASGFVCGEDFRFGHRGQGTAQTLAQYCRCENLPWAIVPEQIVDGIRVSSTYIRQQIETGDMATAVRFLGHPHILTGTVIHGKALGRTLGIPTANLTLPRELAVPKFGVYVCSCRIDGKQHAAVTNLGTRPTVEGSHVTVEAWILDYAGDLYGRELTLEFHYFLRSEHKFPDLQALQAQIHADADHARNYLGKYLL